ncbi:hypothetical protein [Saliniramus sp.]|uniref:COG3904 family protein n=1 Tax=Saliniramus sp. TaxID=2986772 RepID=UPI002BDFB31B|nr:hypothetical protein [Saliniramus sp.]HMB09856.1 hypothetical protein [Saliniramus sp.]
MRQRPVDIYVLRGLLGLALGILAVVSFAIWRSEVRPPPRRVPPPSQFTLAISDDGRTLHFSGTVDFGLTAALRELVAANPQIERMILDSNGGYIAEARGVVTVLGAHRIATHVEGHCASACALIFAGGAQRTLAPDARLGLHGYAMRNDLHYGMIDPKAEMQRDLAIYRAQAISEEFVAKLADLPTSPMWYPDHAELEAAGMITPEAGLR